jgi:hypothetical protein
MRFGVVWSYFSLAGLAVGDKREGMSWDWGLRIADWG